MKKEENGVKPESDSNDERAESFSTTSSSSLHRLDEFCLLSFLFFKFFLPRNAWNSVSLYSDSLLAEAILNAQKYSKPKHTVKRCNQNFRLEFEITFDRKMLDVGC